MKRIASLLAAALLAVSVPAPSASAYVLNVTIADSNDSRNAGQSFCPQLNRFDPNKLIDRRWNTSLTSKIITQASDTAGRTTEVHQAILSSFAAWTGVAGSSLTPSRLGLLSQVDTSCSSNDGRNTICFNQSASFATGVLAFAVVVTSDIIGEKPFPNSGPSAFIGEILDADVLFNATSSSNFTFATRNALNSSSFDLESVLTHELGHVIGFSHSGVLRAMMYPFAPPPGTFLGDRPTAQRPDAQLADDDRTGLRVLYPDMSDAVHIGEISGRVLPANPLALFGIPNSSPGRAVTGIFGAHVVAVDADTGAVIAGVIGGWRCDPNDLPTRFDGTYKIERLPVNRNYIVYVEPLDGPTKQENFGIFAEGNFGALCRQGNVNNCDVPDANTRFNTRIRPSP